MISLLQELHFNFLNKLQAFKFHIPDLCLRHQHLTVKCKCNDIGGDHACILLWLQRQNDLVICVWNKLKRGEAVSRVERSHMLHCCVAEVCGAGQEEVGGASLVCCLFIVLVTGPPRQEEPVLQTLAPCGGFVDQVACRTMRGMREYRGQDTNESRSQL